MIYFCLKSITQINNKLSWDEVHYSTLADKGILYNALEKNSLSFIGFYEIGKARAKKDTLLNNELVKKYNYPDENLNPFYLRHYHPPLATYYWSLFTSSSDIFQKDKSLRISNILLGFAAILSIFLAIYLANILSKKTIVLGVVLSIFLVVSNIFNYSFESLNFHTFQFIFSIIFIASFMRWFKQPSLKKSIFLGVTTALMFLTLETALFIVGGALFALLILKQINLFFRFFIPIFGSFIISIIILWPGVVKTLAPLKTWIMYGARIFLKGNDEYSKVDMSGIWKTMFIENLPLFSLIIILVVLMIYLSNKISKDKTYILPYIVSITYFLSITPFIIFKTYIFPVVGLFIFSIIYSLSILDYSKLKDHFNLNILKYPIILVLTIIVCFPYFNLNFNNAFVEKLAERQEFNADLEDLKSNIKNQKNVIAFNGQALRYYLKNENIKDLRKNSLQNPGFYVRENGLYKNVIEDIKNQKIEAIIIPVEYLSLYPESKTKILEDYNYKKINLKHFQLFLSK